jgi:hypothetical protein
MGFVLYLLVLHLWVLFVLGWQTHALELEDAEQIKDPRAVGLS